jgi:hypothetical protein
MTIVRVSGTVNSIPNGNSTVSVPSGSYTIQAGSTATISAGGAVNIAGAGQFAVTVNSTVTSISAQITTATSLSSTLYFGNTNGIKTGYLVSGNNIVSTATVVSVYPNLSVTITPPTTGAIQSGDTVLFIPPAQDFATNVTFSATNVTMQGAGSVTTVEGQLVVGPHITMANSNTVVTTVLINSTSTANVGNPTGYQYTNTNVYDTATNRVIGSVYVPGGLGVEKDLNVGGYIYGRVAAATSSTQVIVANTNTDAIFYPVFTRDVSGIAASQLYGNTSTQVDSKQGLTYNPASGTFSVEQVLINSTSNSTSTLTGALQVQGGAYIGKDITSLGNLIPLGHDPVTGVPTQTVGTPDNQYLEGFFNNVYSSLIRSINTLTVTGDYAAQNISMLPQAGGYVDIFGDIRVRGQKPVGTAPVVTNVLWVTEDGDDTNDGRAEDPSRACRTISGAVKSPYYQPGTQIRVRAGHYLENNPILLKPYTSVMGSDLRTTSVEPINKTQDLFHVQSGNYIAFMQMTNGRSGLLDGPYLPQYNRGAYATAFPPSIDGSTIDLFHSPYIQNCTNQSGPWLKDGTMFLPDGTVQVPVVVGTSTWSAGDTYITVYPTSTLTQIAVGMSINPGQQTPGFFNARTLLLANKPFMQEQVVAFVDQAFVTGFVYNKDTCKRDAGLILNGVSYDMALGTNFNAVTCGNAYHRGVSYTVTSTELTQTLGAINFLKNTVNAYASTDSTSLARSNTSFDEITSIISSSTSYALTFTNPTGGNANQVYAKNLLVANRTFIQQEVVSWIQTQITGNVSPFVGFSYNSATCYRDVGFIVDALCYDVLYGGNNASVTSALAYYSGVTSLIPGESSQTVAAFNYLSTIAQQIVQGQTVAKSVGNNLTQNTTAPYASATEASTIASLIAITTNAITAGNTNSVPAIVYPSIAWASTATQSVVNSVLSNKSTIITNMIDYIDYTYSGFQYNQAKCYRDTGLIVDSLATDLLYQSTSESTFAGLQYWSQNSYVGLISSEITTTTQAVNYIKFLAVNTATSVGGGALGDIVSADFDQILTILNTGTSGVTDIIVSNGAPSTSTNVIATYNALINAIPSIQAQTYDYITNTLNFTNYNTATCIRDVSYIIESVAFDLLNPNASAGYSNKQAIKAGVYYYGYLSNATVIPNEIPQTTAAYNFIKGIIPSIVTGTPLTSTYQNTVTQVTNLTPGTSHEATTLKQEIDIITNIIRNGPGVAGDKVPMNQTASTSSVVIQAYDLLVANRQFIQAETIAYVNNQLSYFTYSKEKCFRDVGIIVENVAYDAVFGGNEKSVQSGLAYYDGVISRISGQETQTISALDYLNQLCQNVITNTPVTSLVANPTYHQVINTALTGGSIASESIHSNFETITNIIANGPDVAPTIVMGQGPDAAYMSAEILMQANRQFIQQQTINYINWNLSNRQLPYSKIKCERDIGLVIDSIGMDIYQPVDYVTTGNVTTQAFMASTFAGVQYWGQNGYTGSIYNEINQTTDAVTYLRDLSIKIIQNITPTDDLVPRYTTATQVTITDPSFANPATPPVVAGADEVAILKSEFDIILSILGGKNTGWTDKVKTPTLPAYSDGLLSKAVAVELLRANKDYLANEVNAFVQATNPNFVYSTATCYRDVGYIIEAVCFDIATNGNREAIQAGLAYYTTNGGARAIGDIEVSPTVDAFGHMATIAQSVVQNIPWPKTEYVSGRFYNTKYNQMFLTNGGATQAEADLISQAVSTITNIITNGPSIAVNLKPTQIETWVNGDNKLAAWELLQANKDFIIAETIAYIEKNYNATAFEYDEAYCYRDTGLIVDAVSQDILLGGNSKSVEAGLSYWNQGYNYVAGQETTTTLAINYARDISLQIAANQPVAVITGTTIQQVINPFFEYGSNYMPQQAIMRNYDIITTIISRGPLYAPPVFQGSGLFSATGQLADDVKLATKVTYVTDSGIPGAYIVGLNTSTVGFANNATLYFGDVSVYPLSDIQVEALSLEYTGNTSTWNSRKFDPIGSMGGSLVDGAVISSRSPIQSFVYDAFTQVPQGGRGVHVTNNGYAQLVSVFTIFTSIGVQVDNGGIASIVNSNANFGDICLLAKGHGPRAFSGTIYNPAFKAYPNSPGPDGLNQYYPNGFWPNGGNIEVFIPDLANRPHISLVMEVVPEDGHINEQNLPGFLNAQPSLATLSTGTITINGIDNTGVAVGNTVYIRDLSGNFADANGVLYAATGTVVTDVGYQSITLSQALGSGGGDPANANYFTLYFCGNAYYTVLSSTIADQPYITGTNILSIANTSTDQVQAHVNAIHYLNSLTDAVVSNTPLTNLYQSTVTQTILPLVSGGSNAVPFIDLRFNDTIRLIEIPTTSDEAEALYPAKLRTTSGTVPSGAGSAISLINANLDFLATEVSAYVLATNSGTFVYNTATCYRDTGLIVDALAQDLLFNGTSQATFSAIQYWNQSGHVGDVGVQLTTTTNAINYVSSLAQRVIQNDTTGPRYQNTVTQVTNLPAATAVEAQIIANDFSYITQILNTSTLAGLTDQIIPNSLTASTSTGIQHAFALLQANKAYLQAEAIAFINSTETPGFVYNVETCYRDVGYMIDSVSVDLLYPNANGPANRQAFQSGVYYWNYVSTSTRIAGEITYTIEAYQHIANMVTDIIQGKTITYVYQTGTTQVTNLTPGTITEVNTVHSDIGIIKNILENGPTGVTKTPIGVTASADPNVVNAAKLLEANRDFIQAEVVAYINDIASKPFNFNQAKCKRDVKLILQRLIYDIQTGGRYNSVMSGLSYWSRPGTYHIISLGENVRRTDLFPDGAFVNFYQRSYISASGYVFEYVGAGTNYGALPQVGYADPVQSKETVQLDNGKVFFTSTDQNGDFRIGPGLVISQATGVLSGRTFTKSLFANMTPFILAIEGGR